MSNNGIDIDRALRMDSLCVDWDAMGVFSGLVPLLVLEVRKLGKILVIKGLMVGSEAHMMTILISIFDHIAASALSPTLYVSRLSLDVVENEYVQGTSLETDVWYKLCNRRTLTRQPLA